jgi:hypothetical protein
LLEEVAGGGSGEVDAVAGTDLEPPSSTTGVSSGREDSGREDGSSTEFALEDMITAKQKPRNQKTPKKQRQRSEIREWR